MSDYPVYQMPLGERIPYKVKNITEVDAKWFVENKVKLSVNKCLGFDSITGVHPNVVFDDGEPNEFMVIKSEGMSWKKAYRELRVAMEREV